MMEEDGRRKLEVDRKKEKRTKDISKMIDEGGLGAKTYYDIEKKGSVDEANKNKHDEK
ncbi:MAG TPA: hypothetical protein VK108_10420 [Pseudogracilibacillus sp.]|nr:hypothetical protein [Pseudogracilibacillus sp.]